MKKKASDLRPGDILNGQAITEVGTVYWATAQIRDQMHYLVRDRGMKIADAADYLDLRSGVDWLLSWA